MTTDRRKAILYLALTFILGLLIGSLVPSLYGRMRHREGGPRGAMHGREGRHDFSKSDWLTHAIVRIVKPDSAQMKDIRPLTTEAAARIGELEQTSNERMSSIMDSLKLKLKPILTEEQNQRLEDFSKKARQRWRGREGRRP